MASINGFMTILIVDDSRIMRNMIKSYFSELRLPIGHQYLEAGNGEDALKMVLTQKIDLVLVDWNMPKMLGIDFIKQVRALDRYKDIPIMMITIESSSNNVIEALKNGATDYLKKPIKEAVFREKLGKILDKCIPNS